MYRFVAIALGALVLAAPLQAQQDVSVQSIPFAQHEETAIPEIISRQLAAFNSDDVETAFGYASTTIQQIFRNPQMFGIMVKEGFPMVYRSKDAKFLDSFTRDGLVHQKVIIIDEHGVPYLMMYEMILGPEGWQVDGVEQMVDPAIDA